MSKRKIAVVTGTRAEYGLLYWLLKEIQADQTLQLQIIVTGMHLSPSFGNTYKIIEEDGFQIDQKIPLDLNDDSPMGVAKSLGQATIGFAETFQKSRPDLLVLLGDRYEILAAAQAAMIARIPIAHIHGGESTEGLIDEAIRHSITKMSHIHFTTTETYRKRVIQLGEQADTVFNVGAPGIDNILKLPLLSKSELEKELSFTLGSTSFLVTYHPTTLSNISPEVPMLELISALDNFPEAKIIFTMPNADTNGKIIQKVIEEYAKKNPHKSAHFQSLGQLRYLSALKNVNLVIGNSSSGIIEAPALKTATINIGDRQKGRLYADSVLHSIEEKQAITSAIKNALSQEFQTTVKNTASIYGNGNSSPKIKEIIKFANLDKILMKKFNDITS